MARDALARKRILVVDDSLTVINMVRHLLEQEGYIVLAAADGLAAMNTAFREAPDLVIADVEMPEMSGLQLCRLLKGDPRTAAVPFLILSVHQAQHQQFWGRETGADDYLPKPFTPEALLDGCARCWPARAPDRIRRPSRRCRWCPRLVAPQTRRKAPPAWRRWNG